MSWSVLALLELVNLFVEGAALAIQPDRPSKGGEMLRLWSSLLAVVAFALVCAPPALAQKLLMASGYGDTFYHTGNLIELVDDVKKSSGGKLEIELHKNQTLIKLPEIKRVEFKNFLPPCKRFAKEIFKIVRTGSGDQKFYVIMIMQVFDDTGGIRQKLYFIKRDSKPMFYIKSAARKNNGDSIIIRLRKKLTIGDVFKIKIYLIVSWYIR